MKKVMLTFPIFFSLFEEVFDGIKLKSTSFPFEIAWQGSNTSSICYMSNTILVKINLYNYFHLPVDNSLNFLIIKSNNQ